MNKRRLGSVYEHCAAEFLRANGYEILESNFRCRAGEIDLVAKDGEILCFIEVKYRGNLHKGDPLEAVGKNKRARIIRAAQAYISKRCNNNVAQPCRFDAVGIVPGKIRLVKNAFGGM